MRKLTTLFAVAAAALCASATDYTAPMAVEVMGELIPQGETTITLAQEDNAADPATYYLCLNNFIFDYGNDSSVPFGNITLYGMEPTEVDGDMVKFDCKGTAKVTAGTKPGVNWLGPIMMMAGAKLELTAEMTPDTLEATITILNAPAVGALTVYFGEETVAKAGVENVAAESNAVVGTYDLRGIRIDNPQPGKIYIEKLANGKARKTYIK